ncbi:hypothetical protein E1171_16270 [Cytophagales bacterium RKSG123]|nr:hypothetical protein [Xanthovirga aplysinae]
MNDPGINYFEKENINRGKDLNLEKKLTGKIPNLYWLV